MVSEGNYLVPGTFRAALAMGAEVSESPPEETLANIHRDLCLFPCCSHDFAAGIRPVLRNLCGCIYIQQKVDDFITLLFWSKGAALGSPQLGLSTPSMNQHREKY